MSSTNVRFEWFQTLYNITFTYYIKNKTEEDVTIDLQPKSLDVTIVVDKATGQEYQHSVGPFFGSVKTETLQKTIKSMKIELVVEKAEAFQWTTLEGSAAVASSSATAAPTATTTPAPVTINRAPGTTPATYPNSKGKDWSKFKMDEEEEVVGDPTNAFFKQIFGNGTDEQRRAMMKSFQESGGTVLSTNWNDVGNRTVKAEPPKGMDERKWNE